MIHHLFSGLFVFWQIGRWAGHNEGRKNRKDKKGKHGSFHGEAPVPDVKNERFGNQARSILNILRNVLSETQRKNGNCLSPVQQDEFSNFSCVSLARFKMGKPASAGISNRNYPNRIEMPFTPAAHGWGIKKA
jgi:hypothetical protein